MERKYMENRLKNTFDALSPKYDIQALRFFRNSAEYFASILHLRGDERVLDVAAGTGHLTLAVSKYIPAGGVTGIDFSAGMLKQAKRKADSMAMTNVRFVEMDMGVLYTFGNK
jgi:ubiquinone/menaquinone biosynthesis C-methylase UbiE